MEMKMALALHMLIALVLVVGAVVAVVFGAMAAARRNRQTPQPQPLPSGPAREESRAERAAILKKLAEKEITREEAEAQLGTLGDPVPPVMPPTPASTSAGGSGCLIGVLVAVGLGLLLVVLGVVGCWSLKFPVGRRHSVEMQAVALPAQLPHEARKPDVRAEVEPDDFHSGRED